jgi:hypothetical protein
MRRDRPRLDKERPRAKLSCRDAVHFGIRRSRPEESRTPLDRCTGGTKWQLLGDRRVETYPRIDRFRAIASIPGRRSPATLTLRTSEDAGQGRRVTPPVPSLARRVGMSGSAARVVYFPPVALPITGNGRVARQSLVKRLALRTARPKGARQKGIRPHLAMLLRVPLGRLNNRKFEESL